MRIKKCRGARVGQNKRRPTQKRNPNEENNTLISCFNGGRGGIRTPGGVPPTTVFKTAAINRTLPPFRRWCGAGRTRTDTPLPCLAGRLCPDRPWRSRRRGRTCPRHESARPAWHPLGGLPALASAPVCHRHRHPGRGARPIALPSVCYPDPALRPRALPSVRYPAPLPAPVAPPRRHFWICFSSRLRRLSELMGLPM